MKINRVTLSLALLFLWGCVGACDGLEENHRPRLHSLIANPDSLDGSGDSTTVVCVATDPDGDRLVFDWITDARLIIKGVNPNQNHLYNSPNNTQVFYRSAVAAFDDSGWVQCYARDRRGMSASRLIIVTVR